jgi:hypothetical protein
VGEAVAVQAEIGQDARLALGHGGAGDRAGHEARGLRPGLAGQQGDVHRRDGLAGQGGQPAGRQQVERGAAKGCEGSAPGAWTFQPVNSVWRS